MADSRESGQRNLLEQTLLPDQNFFDQVPFSIVSRFLSQRVDIAEDDVRAMLWHIAKAEIEIERKREFQKAAGMEMNEAYYDQQRAQIITERIRQNVEHWKDRSLRGRIRQLVILMTTALDEDSKSLFWREYINTQHNISDYTVNGHPTGRNRNSRVSPPLLFSSWQAKKIRYGNHR